jgi:MFS transporter, PAT family, beta-lactamase induction signal transducer AmpG
LRRDVPVWLLGLTNLPLGVTGAVALLIAPQVLAARHVPETTIASVTALGLAGTFCFFLVAPILDVQFSRRTYAMATSVFSAVVTFAAVMSFASVGLLGIWLFLALLAANLNQAAIGGWFGSVLPHGNDAKLGAWFTIANSGGFGVTSIVGIGLVHHQPLWLAATVLAAMNLLALPIIFWVHPPTGDRSRLHESFGRFGRELVLLPRRPEVRRMFLLLVLPCASFALTNTLGGLGGDYHASEKLIALIAGFGITIAGVLGSLSVPVLSRRTPLLTLYLGIGFVGGLSTLLLIALPHTAFVYTGTFIAQNIWQSAALSTGNALILSSIGKNNPVASTQFAVLSAAMSAPIAYMQWFDGQAYGAHGLSGLYLTDGGLDLLACTAMTMLFFYWFKRANGQAARAAPSLV